MSLEKYKSIFKSSLILTVIGIIINPTAVSAYIPCATIADVALGLSWLSLGLAIALFILGNFVVATEYLFKYLTKSKNDISYEFALIIGPIISTILFSLYILFSVSAFSELVFYGNDYRVLAMLVIFIIDYMAVIYLDYKIIKVGKNFVNLIGYVLIVYVLFSIPWLILITDKRFDLMIFGGFTGGSCF